VVLALSLSLVASPASSANKIKKIRNDFKIVDSSYQKMSRLLFVGFVLGWLLLQVAPQYRRNIEVTPMLPWRCTPSGKRYT